MVTAWLVAGLEKVKAVDRGPWLPAVGSETPTVYVMKLGSPKDFSLAKASTAGDPDFTWKRGQVWRDHVPELRSPMGLGTDRQDSSCVQPICGCTLISCTHWASLPGPIGHGVGVCLGASAQ